jgi:hypothetical protein
MYEDVVQVIQLPLVIAEIGHRVLIGRDEDSSAAGDCESWNPVLAFG